MSSVRNAGCRVVEGIPKNTCYIYHISYLLRLPGCYIIMLHISYLPFLQFLVPQNPGKSHHLGPNSSSKQSPPIRSSHPQGFGPFTKSPGSCGHSKPGAFIGTRRARELGFLGGWCGVLPSV